MNCEFSTMERDEYRNVLKNVWSGILEWGEKKMREFPWRDTTDAYMIFIAEVMLHRTGAPQVEKIYRKFIDEYPDFGSIVESTPDRIKSDLYSLGLQWRVDLLYRMAEEIEENHGGKLPSSREELRKLPGVGDYTASAVMCFAYNLPEPILDTNTVRVIGRISGLKITDSSRRSKKFEKIMRDMVAFGEPRRFSFSLLDFAAEICTPGNDPECGRCPVRNNCCYFVNMGER